MKKIILLIFLLVFSLGLATACSNTKETSTIINKGQISNPVNEQDIREIAYNQLTSNDKRRIKGTWQDSTFSKITLRKEDKINDKFYIGKEVYMIDFPTNFIGKPNNMLIFVSMDSHKFLGYGMVD